MADQINEPIKNASDDDRNDDEKTPRQMELSVF